MKHLLFPFFFITLIACGQNQKTITKEEIDALPVIRTLSGSIPMSNIGKDTFSYFSVGDNNLSRYKLPAHFKKPKKWMQMEDGRKEEEKYREILEKKKPDTLHLQQALAFIDTAKQFFQVVAAKNWCMQHYEEAFPQLISRLSVKQKIGLENTADLIIWCRMGTGELEFYGHGWSVNADLFTVAGRASWILYELTGEDFGIVYCDLTKKQAAHFKEQWVAYISKLQQ